MPCKWVKLPDGTTAIVKLAAPRRQRCYKCGDLVHPVLCDAPVGDGKTCDRPCCPKHSHHVPPDTDFCLEHAAEW
jgi:hypothetical protein